MVALLLMTLLQATPAPAPAQPAKPPVTTPAKPPAPRPRAASTATTTALLFVTDSAGAPVEGVTVTFTGPVDREVKSPATGATRVQGLRAGTYRVRFAHEDFITFERELSWRAGTAAPELAITLNAAPEATAAAPPPPAATPAPAPTPAAPKLPPPGAPKTLSLPDYIEKNFITGREPHKEDMVGCSGVGQAVLWQVRDPWEGRQHPSADGMLYVVGGEGAIRIDGRDVSLTAGSFAVVPRGTTYGFTRRGRNPLIVLAVLAGAPCAAE
jgi:mannose-6-phosphate isomerase-like protein (cupin superfamily)